MYNTQYTTHRGRKAIRVLEMIVFFTILLSLSYGIATKRITAQAEERTVRAWIMCQPKDYVNAREAPSTRSESLGMLETGFEIEVDGRTKNGFAHAYVSLEKDNAWIHSGYIVFSEPKAMGGELRVITFEILGPLNPSDL